MSTRNKKQLRRKAPERRRIDSGIREPSKSRRDSGEGEGGEGSKLFKGKKHKKAKKSNS